MTAKPATIDDYIAGFSPAVKTVLQHIRETIQAAAPGAQEAISYAIPTFKLNGKNLVHFAGYDKHIGLYATPTGHEAFKDDFANYKTGKGSAQFPLDKPMPVELIKRIVAFRIKEISRKSD